MWPRHSARENALPLTDAQAHRIRVASFLTGDKVRLDLVLPCERCWWMPADCTCRGVEVRAMVVRTWRADGHRASVADPMTIPARITGCPTNRPLSLSRPDRDGGAA